MNTVSIAINNLVYKSKYVYSGDIPCFQAPHHYRQLRKMYEQDLYQYGPTWRNVSDNDKISVMGEWTSTCPICGSDNQLYTL